MSKVVLSGDPRSGLQFSEDGLHVNNDQFLFLVGWDIRTLRGVCKCYCVTVTRGSSFTPDIKLTIKLLSFGCLIASFVAAYKVNESFDIYMFLFGIWCFGYLAGKKFGQQ